MVVVVVFFYFAEFGGGVVFGRGCLVLVFLVVLARQFDGVVGVVGGDRIRCW